MLLRRFNHDLNEIHEFLIELKAHNKKYCERMKRMKNKKYKLDVTRLLNLT